QTQDRQKWNSKVWHKGRTVIPKDGLSSNGRQAEHRSQIADYESKDGPSFQRIDHPYTLGTP
ncbi:hypothetical protein HAX54_010817, partial [Datura stramonium]|nr:hypothetical protein [Datura stramonium]